MNIGIVGLGLIGGSLAKAFKSASAHTVFGLDLDAGVVQYAKMIGAIDQALTPENVPQCDIILIALYPAATLEFLETHAANFNNSAIVIDCCGVKEVVCPRGFDLAEQHGFHFVGGHPMAGIQYSGIKHARENLFNNAVMILVPKAGEDLALIQQVKDLLSLAGFSKISLTTAADHDRVIAFTSQLAHVVSNAYVKSPTATLHKGFSAGSYKDLTRVARLNETMWSELFLDNAANLSNEIGTLIAELGKYKVAIDAGDFDGLKDLLREGRELKEMIESRG